MPTRSVIVLVLGIVIALGAALSLRSRMSEPAGDAARTKVLIANADIPAGSFVRADYHLAFADWPKDNITDSMLTTDNTRITDFEGAVARRTITKGEPILKATLVKSNEGGFMSAVLDPGKRAISIAVDSTSGNAGFIFPGDHVDLILTHLVQTGQQKERASETFIEDVRVLAIDQMIDNPENKAVLAKTVTLEVTPKQAEEINVAKDLGKISLSLRSLASKTEPADGEVPLTSFDDVLQMDLPAGGPEQNLTRDTEVSKIITPQGAAGTSVRVIRGKQTEEIEFLPGGGKVSHDVPR